MLMKSKFGYGSCEILFVVESAFRCGLFFAECVLLVEGMTEVVFINYLVAKGCIELPKGGLFVLDCLGKYNMHRFMNLLCEFKINHSVMYDSDNKNKSKEKPKKLARLIRESRNKYTLKIGALDPDIEGFLGICEADKPHRKPQHLMFQYHQEAIASDKLDKFTEIVNGLVN